MLSVFISTFGVLSLNLVYFAQEFPKSFINKIYGSISEKKTKKPSIVLVYYESDVSIL